MSCLTLINCSAILTIFAVVLMSISMISSSLNDCKCSMSTGVTYGNLDGFMLLCIYLHITISCLCCKSFHTFVVVRGRMLVPFLKKNFYCSCCCCLFCNEKIIFHFRNCLVTFRAFRFLALFPAVATFVWCCVYAFMVSYISRTMLHVRSVDRGLVSILDLHLLNLYYSRPLAIKSLGNKRTSPIICIKGVR